MQILNSYQEVEFARVLFHYSNLRLWEGDNILINYLINEESVFVAARTNLAYQQFPNDDLRLARREL